MALRFFDEVNEIANEEEWEPRSVPYSQYFGEMSISDDEKEKREELARQFEDIFLVTFALIKTMRYTEEYMANRLYRDYIETVSNFSKPDDYLKEYASGISQDIVGTTFRNIDSKYFTSADRAMFIAENEANTDMNYLEYVKAVNDGKTRKKWIDMKDKRERKTHLKVGSMVLPIERPFPVGDSLMQFPKDFSLGADAKEIVNCRCSIQYY